MLWQCHEDTQIMFLDVLWPDFDLWSFLPVLWEWQWRARKSQAASGTEDEIVESKQGVKKVSRSKLRAEGVKAHAA